MQHGKFLLILVLFYIFLSPELAHALRVGVAPGSINLGTVERGENVRLTFYILSDTDEKLPLNLEYEEINPFNIHPEWNLTELSEESFEPWINFLEGTRIEIPVTKIFYEEIQLAVNKKVDAILNIPANAEPGYHTANIALHPLVPPPAERGARITIITTANLRITFRVDGEVNRDLEVLGFLEKMENPTTLLVTVFVRNKGNVTLLAELSNLKLYDGNKIISSVRGTKSKLKPGEIGNLITRLDARNLEEGKRYNASVTVIHRTGEITKVGSIVVPKYVVIPEVKPPPPVFPWWIVIVVIGVITLIIIRRYR
ncbi:MAG: hypothetical protein QMD14_01215 [Candidatus Aenigmarchaeota archaeon]|nr:hypothetical protein [Candidatus Aenigmarchaeota archaeon]